MKKVFRFLPILMGLIGFESALADIKSQAQIYSDSFISPDFEASDRAIYQFMGVKAITDPLTQDSVTIDIKGGMAIGAPVLNYIGINEFYTGKREPHSDNLFFGRMKSNWSELDRRWKLGVWEPVFKWNPLDPERQGLTGLFWEAERKGVRINLFASPIYFPSQGPGFDIENGSFVKTSPWFHRPPATIRIWSEATEIDYRLEKPQELQVVLQNSFGGQIAFGDPSSWNLHMSYIYKPMNDLAVGYKGALSTADLRGKVDIQPQVFYHSLASIDYLQRAGGWTWGLSSLYDRPTPTKAFDPEYTYPVFQPSLLVSPFLQRSFKDFIVRIERLDVVDGHVSEVGDLADPTRPALTSRYLFRQANGISLQGRLGRGSYPQATGEMAYLTSDNGDFQLMRFSANLKLSRLWSLFSDLQLMKAKEGESENSIAQFSNNDRLSLGATYVF